MNNLINKRLKKFVLLIFLLIFVSLSNGWKNNVIFASDFSTSTSEIVIEVESGRVLHECNADEKKYMASTTKILTAICVIENCDIDEVITVAKDTIGVEGSSIYLEEGEKLSVKDLLYGLMLRSGNDCAETLAKHVSGSISAFSDLMNKTAEKIGAINSHFTNPHGLHDDNHYTTARDLAFISRYAIKNPIFAQIVSTKTIKIPFTTRNTERLLINKNKMLRDFYGSTGIKTGFTRKAGRCLVSSCERNDMKLISVVLNCPPMFERSKNILENAFNVYSLKTVVDSKNIIDFLPIENQDKKTAIGIKQDIKIPLSSDEIENIDVVYEYPDKIFQTTKIGDCIGEVKIFASKKLLFIEKIYTI